MKKSLFLTLIFCAVSLIAREKADRFTSGSNDQTRDPRMDQMSYVPNEILVKFKDETSISTASKIKAAGISKVDQVLQKYEITSLERLFPKEKKPTRSKVMRAPNGAELKVPALDKIYRVTVPNTETPLAHPVNIHQIIEELKALPEIEYAEPNYIYTIGQTQPIGPELTADDLARMQSRQQNANGSAVVPNDPLYPQQWYIPAVKADLVWEQTTGDTTQVIAILDTGVDWTHPDLTNKIWRNWGEIPDNGIDDDSNGLVDDYMGWDYINNDNNPMDDNSHGTHVAGIAAAEANNGIGIAGVNWQAKVMPIKVFQSSGRGDVATITKGIIYAAQKGATVINMSFGSYARSMAMEDALANAYATTFLVAAAGNDGGDIETCLPIIGPFFPAAFSFVLGVQVPEAFFSNTDCNGPTFSNFAEFFNYEMKAPGTNIISTIPKGSYRVYQGTSMAAPIVSGALSLYRKLISYDDETNEFMWVKLIQATEQYLDIHKALTLIPNPEVWFLNKVMVDTLGTSDRDGRVDAGERIQLWFRARNTGGQVDSVYWKIRLAEFEDTTTCKIIKPTSFIGSISPYATRTSENDPMMLDISPNVAHGRDITFDLLSWFKGATDTLVQKFVLTPENGEELFGVLDTEKILYPDRLYLINQSFKIGIDGTLIIKPGTNVLFYPGKTVPVNGKLIANGKPDSLIVLSGYIPPTGGTVNNIFEFRNGGDKFTYCKFENMNFALSGYSAELYNCTFNYIYCIGSVGSINNCNYIAGSPYHAVEFTRSIYRSNFIGPSTSSMYSYSSEMPDKNIPSVLKYVNLSTIFSVVPLKYNNFFNYAMSIIGEYENQIPTYQNNWISEYKKYKSSGSVFYDNPFINIIKCQTLFNSSNDFQNIQHQYWGTNDSLKIEGFIYDFMDQATRPKAKFYPFLNAPNDSCHAIVWKVLVNGKDPQDEVVEPVGVGRQRFDVYFNRPMDKTAIPNVSFGVRYPFSSNAVNEDGEWSEDGRIYTVYKTVKLTSGDGINRIRVVGAKDLEGWEIPTEDMRFEFLIDAAGSASLDFMATPGLGKVELEWNDNDLEDGLGYNMYRMEHINDSTLTQPVIINNSLITDTLYTDYSVVPNKRYYYYYKILRTNMAETDSSRVVSAIPFTASKGDANGDLSVNVLDITTIVAYLLNNNPQPFIFEAADVNSDGQINVLDIVGVVNLVLNVPQNAIGISMNKQVDLYLQNDTLFANSNVNIGAIQFDLAGIAQFSELEVLDALKTFESGNSYANGNLRVIFYSMSGKSIEPGQAIPLLKLKSGSMINDAIIGEPNGSSVKVNYIKTRIPDISANMNQTIAELGQNYPNPANIYTTIPVRIYEPVDELVLRITNMMGQEVEVIRLSNPVTGENLINWNPKHHKGLLMYKLEIRQGNNRSVCPAKRMMVR